MIISRVEQVDLGFDIDDIENGALGSATTACHVKLIGHVVPDMNQC